MKTLVIKKSGRIIFESELKGLRPLAEFINVHDLEGYEVYDKVIGEAAARVYCFFRVKKADCELISESAVKRFENAKIMFSYKQKVEQILRLDRKGVCPGEIDSMNFEKDEEFIEHIKKKFL